MSKRRFKKRPFTATKRGRAFEHRRAAADSDEHDARPRLQKVLAAAGLGSRRKCEELISLGRVEVDRRVVKQLGTRVDPVQQEIRVDGEPLPRPKRQYFMLNKPMGVVSTARDPAGRPRVTDLIKSNQRLFPVGRLDISSEGLILVTNDGELANLLAHPRYEVEKTYLAQVVGAPSRESLAKLERGVHLAEGYAHARRVRIKSQHKQSSTLEIVLDEGRNREVRRLLARVGHKVLRLKRIAIGPLRLGDLMPGEFRPLGSDEVRELKETALAAAKRDRRAPRTVKPESSTGRDQIVELTPPRSPAQAPVAPISAEFDDDYQPPRRPGAIIGAEENEAEASSPVKRRTGSVKPIIDVRRGIFPGRNNDDFDDDELDDAPSPPPVTRPKKSQRQYRGGQSRFKKAGPRRPGRPRDERGAHPPRGRKGRRR
jgi:23S rRNA pseudouridine2605 synthase